MGSRVLKSNDGKADKNRWVERGHSLLYSFHMLSFNAAHS